jgi:Amt family ammonium transporter
VTAARGTTRSCTCSGAAACSPIGARDFAGGIVVHASAGWAALASVLYVGKRKFVDLPHNIPFIALGTGLLWFGWYGFNAGSVLKVDDITAIAFINTDIVASFAAITWLFVEWWYAKKPHFVGLLTGAVAGLATITPAAGYVPIYASVVIGISAGVVCYYAIQLKNRLHWDDALDVWGVHGIGGLSGSCCSASSPAQRSTRAGRKGWSTVRRRSSANS